MDERNYKIDFTKGFLVIAMGLYHSLVYCLSEWHILYRYVSYVAEAFIFYSGYLVGTIYLYKYNRRNVTHRLVLRGAKLFLLFILLNIMILTFFGTRTYTSSSNGVEFLMKNIVEILLQGNDKIVAFEILLPISYLLISAPLILYTMKYKYSFFLSLMLFFAYVSVMEIHLSYNIKALLIGIGGVYSGVLSSEMKNILNNYFLRCLVLLLCFAYFTIFIPLGLHTNTFLYYLTINIVIASLHLLSPSILRYPSVMSSLCLYGRYSLLLYLFQILFLQITVSILDIASSTLSFRHIMVFIILNVISLMICKYSLILQTKSITYNKLYRLVFS